MTWTNPFHDAGHYRGASTTLSTMVCNRRGRAPNTTHWIRTEGYGAGRRPPQPAPTPPHAGEHHRHHCMRAGGCTGVFGPRAPPTRGRATNKHFVTLPARVAWEAPCGRPSPPPHRRPGALYRRTIMEARPGITPMPAIARTRGSCGPHARVVARAVQRGAATGPLHSKCPFSIFRRWPFRG